MNKKTCAVVKAEEKQPCIPFGYHCKYGLQCKQIPVVEETISLRQLFYPANDQDYYDGQYGQPFEVEKILGTSMYYYTAYNCMVK